MQQQQQPSAAHLLLSSRDVSFFNVSYVCPEPVLANIRVLADHKPASQKKDKGSFEFFLCTDLPREGF